MKKASPPIHHDKPRWTEVDGYERALQIDPAFDFRTDPEWNQYGQHSVEMRWLLRGNKGVVQFLLYTHWSIDDVSDLFNPLRRYDPSEMVPRFLTHPLPADLGYHSKVPRYSDHKPFDCTVLPKGKCYYDGSSLQAEHVFEVLVRMGGEAVWTYLEDYYKRVFDE